MATKAIKLWDGSSYLLPVSNANLIQMTVDGVSKSVQDVILEDEEVTAAGYNDLDSRLTDIENAGFTTNTGTVTSVNATGALKTSDDNAITTTGTIEHKAGSSLTEVAANALNADSGTVVSGIKRDGYGHVVGIKSTSIGETIDGAIIGTQADLNHYASCSTAAGTAAKTATVNGSGGFRLVDGAQCIIKFTNTNTAPSPTLNINSTGDKSMFWHDVQVKYQTLASGYYYHFVYNGTSWVIIGTSFHGIPFGTCSTAAATAAKTATAPGFHLCTGAKATIKFTNANTAASPTLNINGLGAKSIYYNGAVIANPTSYLLKGTITFTYDGTYFYIDNSDRATFFDIKDTRSTNDAPYAYPKQMTGHLKTGTTIGLNKGYVTLLEIAGWNDTSGGPTHEIGFSQNDSGIWHRVSANATTWGDWKQILESDTMNLSYTISSGAETLTLSYGDFSNTIPIDLRYEVFNATAETLTIV